MCNWCKTINKPFTPSCERNQGAILDVLKKIIQEDDKHLLEIGSGTGQHAVFMVTSFPSLKWHTSDLLDNHSGIIQWIDEAQNPNIITPIEFKSGKTQFPKINLDIVYSANTLHIMSWDNVKTLIVQLGRNLKQDARVLFYGPFNYQGSFTSDSNAKFDMWLKEQEPHRGIRDIDSIIELMSQGNLELVKDYAMPANNRLLHFIKR